MINQDIKEANKTICDNIDKKDILGVGLLSQNVLGQLRNIVEFIAIRIWAEHIGEELENSQENNKNALDYIKTRGDIRFLSKFHNFLQVSRSHYVTDYDNAERLMLKYLEYLLKLRDYTKQVLGIDILHNLDDFPMSEDDTYDQYYEQISDSIKIVNQKKIENLRNDRFYIRKVKPFYSKGKIYYEVTLTKASDHASKFDRVIAFTDKDIFTNYAVIVNLVDAQINVFGVESKVKIIYNWKVNIRVCEVNNFIKIFESGKKIGYSNAEHNELNEFLTHSKMSLVEIIDLPIEYYEEIKSKIHNDKMKITHIFDALDKCRIISQKKKAGVNIIRYLLLRLNNKIIKWQYYPYTNPKLSDLYLSYKSISFDEMPFITSPANHNPRLYDIFECIDSTNREHELLARIVKNNTENKSKLYTNIDEVSNFTNIEELVQKYNNNIFGPQRETRKLVINKKHLYINSYEKDTITILKQLDELKKVGVSGHKNTVESWLKTSNYVVDDPSKNTMLLKMFEDTKVALVYGAAGTGKTFLAEHISHLYAKLDKLFLANTHPAVNNLKRRVNNNNSRFQTVAKYLFAKIEMECDVLIIDECSTLSNAYMREILAKTEFKILVLIGDIYQIESIRFGNWFSIAKKSSNQVGIYELEVPYRTKNKDLLNLWKNVRLLTDKVQELLSRGKYSKKLDETIFDSRSEDEIILCLNYDGIYGINSINTFLQNNNPNPLFEWGVNGYKVDDPVLFNESNRFSPIVYNNLKGKIISISKTDKMILFDIEIDKAVSELEINGIDLELVESDNMKSVIRFSVDAYRNSDEDEDENTKNTVVPFQIAYAVSIHKAQGLEYSSVKVIITKETEEMITHNIFYTAITRTTKYLKVYWSPVTQEYVLGNLKLIDDNKDYNLIKDKI